MSKIAEFTRTDQVSKEQFGGDPIRTEWAGTDPLLKDYYDTEWGMPVYDETGVFERISLEIFQGGLSWLTVLKKRAALRKAFRGFEVDRVAALNENDIELMLKNENLIRNGQKIRSIINNAKIVASLREERGDNWLSEYVWSFMPEKSPAVNTLKEMPSKTVESEDLSKGLKKLGFKFFGPVMAFATMTAIGVADGHVMSSYRRGCSGLWNVDGTRISG